MDQLLLNQPKPWLNARVNSLTADEGLTQPRITAVAGMDLILSAAHNGSLIVLPQATANNVVTLPAPFAGATFEFISASVANGTNTWRITEQGGSPLLSGSMLAVPGAPTFTTVSGTTITYSATAANTKPGDYARLISPTGSTWVVSLLSQGTAAGWSVA